MSDQQVIAIFEAARAEMNALTCLIVGTTHRFLRMVMQTFSRLLRHNAARKAVLAAICIVFNCLAVMYGKYTSGLEKTTPCINAL